MLTTEWLNGDDVVHLHASVRLVAASDGPATDAAAASAVMVMQEAASCIAITAGPTSRPRCAGCVRRAQCRIVGLGVHEMSRSGESLANASARRRKTHMSA